MWLLISLLAPIFYALVHILDSHCVSNIFEKPWIGVITSSIASLMVFLVVPFVAPFVSWQLPSITIIILAIMAGVALQLGFAFYFQALYHSEAGIIAAYWNMVPAVLPIINFFIFGTILSTNQYLGIALLIIASAAICLLDTNLHARWRSFFLMLGASSFQVLAYLLEAEVFKQSSYFVGFLLVTTGMILSGLVLLVRKKFRTTFKSNFYRIRPAMHIIIIIEIANLIALAATQKAVALTDTSLVSAIVTALPIFTFLLSLAFLYIIPKLGDPKARHKLHLKFVCVTVMVIGVILIS